MSHCPPCTAPASQAPGPWPLRCALPPRLQSPAPPALHSCSGSAHPLAAPSGGPPCSASHLTSLQYCLSSRHEFFLWEHPSTQCGSPCTISQVILPEQVRTRPCARRVGGWGGGGGSRAGRGCSQAEPSSWLARWPGRAQQSTCGALLKALPLLLHSCRCCISSSHGGRSPDRSGTCERAGKVCSRRESMCGWGDVRQPAAGGSTCRQIIQRTCPSCGSRGCASPASQSSPQSHPPAHHCHRRAGSGGRWRRRGAQRTARRQACASFALRRHEAGWGGAGQGPECRGTCGASKRHVLCPMVLFLSCCSKDRRARKLIAVADFKG